VKKIQRNPENSSFVETVADRYSTATQQRNRQEVNIMKNVTEKTIGRIVQLVERHIERQIELRVYDGCRVDYGRKH
jgi:hypothetical protein